MTDDIQKTLLRNDACRQAIPWASGFATWEELWQACDAPDWMLWGLDKFGYKNDRRLRLFAASCALRVQRLWDDPQAARAIETATDAATGKATAAELAAAHRATLAARDRLPERADFSESMAAAATAAASALRDVAMDAAMDASRESARAIWWDPDSPGSWREEGTWQANELRRIIGPDIDPLITEIRKRSRGVLEVVR